MHRVRTPNLIRLTLLASALATLAGCGPRAGAPPEFPPAVVEVAKASTDVVPDESQYIARFESRKSLTLSPRVGGIVRAIETSSGSLVPEGKVLLRIEASQQEAAVRSAAAGAESRSTDIDQARAQLASLEAEKLKRESDLKLAKVQLDRAQTLQRNGVVSRQDLDVAQASYETATSAVRAIGAQIEAQKAAIRQAQNDAKQAGEQLAEQKAQLRFYDISAPFTGVVGDIPVKVGDYVSPTSQLMTITVNQPLEAYVYVPVEKSASLRTGMPVRLASPDGQDLGEGSVSFVAPAAEGADQTILIKVEYANGEGRVRAGELGQARIAWSRDAGLWVPATAVTQLAGQQFVFVARTENGRLTARQIPVTLGEPTNSRYPVIEGITANDDLIVAGTQSLFDNAPITIKDHAAAPQ